MSVEELTTFLGWVTVINIGVLLFSTFMVVAFRNAVSSIHVKMFSMNKEDLPNAYFNYLANYKIFTIIFNLAPYLTLRLMF